MGPEHQQCFFTNQGANSEIRECIWGKKPTDSLGMLKKFENLFYTLV